MFLSQKVCCSYDIVNSRFYCQFVSDKLLPLPEFVVDIGAFPEAFPRHCLTCTFCSLIGIMYVFSSNFTAQYTRLQFRSHSTASRTNQGLQNRSVHLTRRWAEICFRGHSTGWWLTHFHILPRQHIINGTSLWILFYPLEKAFNTFFIIEFRRILGHFVSWLGEMKKRFKRLQCLLKSKKFALPLRTCFLSVENCSPDYVYSKTINEH